MELRSQIMELIIPDSSGKQTKYYTYDGYLQQHQRLAIRKYRRDINKRTDTISFLIFMLTYHVLLFAMKGSRKSQLPPLHLKKWKVPTKGLLSGVLGSLGAYLLFEHLGTRLVAQFQTTIAQKSAYLPCWLHKNLAVNPDRAYFQLIDGQNNQISIFHAGLTSQAAARILPDLVIGGVPIKPHDPLLHLH